MKTFYLLTAIIFLFIAGCSSSYRVTDYSQEKINSSIDNRDINVVTVDSSFTSFAGSRLKDDSLMVVSRIQKKLSMNDIKEIKEIKYYGGDFQRPSASILLKSGRELRADNVKISQDSTIQFTSTENKSIPIDKIKEISYKTGWQGALTGLPIGFGSGIIIGGILGSEGAIFHINSGGMKDTFDKGESTFVGMVSGALIGMISGAIAGAIIGWDYTYHFNH